jgi:ABC-type branched-subunit amino acid transport system substrate-binding protein
MSMGRGLRIRSSARSMVVAAALVVLASACGSRLPDEALARIDARDAAGGGGGGGGDDQLAAAGDLPTGTGDDGGKSDVPGGGGGGGGQDRTGAAGSQDGPASAGGPGGGTNSGGDASCHGGNTDRGVTANEIKVASMVTSSGPLPGATEGAYHGAAAYFAKINAAGGVCGRKITLLMGDDGLDGQRARGEFSRLEPQVVAFVGSLAVADSGYVDAVKKTGVPYFGTFVDPAGRLLPSVVPRSEKDVGYTGPFVYYRKAYPKAKKAGFVYADVGGVRANTPTSREPMKKAGYDIVYDSGLQIAAPDYTAEIINMRNKGVQMLYLFAVEVNMHVRLARNMRQQNWEPELKVSQIGYNSRLTGLLGDAANGWTNHLTYLPVINEDEPAKSPAVADFLSWNRKAFPSGQIDLFPVGGWGDADLFVQTLRRLGPDVTRNRLIDVALTQIKRHDDGVEAPYDPTTGITEGCFVIARVEKGKWVREHPAKGYECGMGERFKYG